MNQKLTRRVASSLLLTFMLATTYNIVIAANYAYTTSQTTATVRTPTVQLQPGTAGSSTVSNGIYATVTITSSAMPLYYDPITLTNNQGSATPVPFQVLIQPNPSLYSAYEASNLGNVRFCVDTFCTVMLYSWLEGCGASSLGACSTSSTSAAFWVRLTSAITPGGGTLVIYMAFLSTSTQFDGNIAGENPTLSTTYAQYDNGANVFNFYDNFAGTSGPSTASWTTSSYGTGATFTTSNKLVITCGAGLAYNAAVIEKTALTTPQVAEADLISETSNLFTDLGVGSGWDNTANGVANNGYTISWNGQTGTQYDRFWVDNAGTRTMVASTAAGSITSFPAGVWTVNWYATGQEAANDGVGNPGTFTETNNAVTLPSSYVMVIGEASSTGASGTVTVQWARMRSSPPSDVMPSASFGSITPAANGVILTFTNSGSSSWLANLAVVTSSNTARLTNLTLSFKSPYSKQVILGTGVPNQNSGPQVTLAASSAIAIVIGVTVSSAGTSTVTLGLKIQSPPAHGVTSVYCYDEISLTVN